MLSNRDYIEFEEAVEEILDKCFIGVNMDPKTADISRAVDGYTTLTRENRYCFTEDWAQYKEQLVSICEALPRYPAVHEDSCSTIAYADLIPNNITTKNRLLDTCELADVFFALLELNHIGVADDAFASKYGFQVAIVNKKYQDRLKPNRSAFVSEEDLEPNI